MNLGFFQSSPSFIQEVTQQTIQHRDEGPKTVNSTKVLKRYVRADNHFQQYNSRDHGEDVEMRHQRLPELKMRARIQDIKGAPVPQHIRATVSFTPAVQNLPFSAPTSFDAWAPGENENDPFRISTPYTLSTGTETSISGPYGNDRFAPRATQQSGRYHEGMGLFIGEDNRSGLTPSSVLHSTSQHQVYDPNGLAYYRK